MPRVWVAPAALLVSLFEVGFWIEALVRFDFDRGGLQESNQRDLVQRSRRLVPVGFYQGFSVWLVGLTTVVHGGLDRLRRRGSGRDRPRAYYGLMLFLTGAIVGVFTAQDLLLFYVFWEAMLIPLYVLIGVWGGPGRLQRDDQVRHLHDGRLAADAGRDDRLRPPGRDVRHDRRRRRTPATGSSSASPPRSPSRRRSSRSTAGCRTPTASRRRRSSAVLSGVISKAAAFGFLRICFSLFPAGVQDFRTPILVLAAIGLVYGSLLAFRAPDIRGVIAYSSLAQMGLIMLGLFATNVARDQRRRAADGQPRADLRGAVHARRRGRAAGGDRASSTSLGGMAKGRPALATVLMTTGVIALAVPGSTAFAGEFLILAGVFQQGWGYAVVGAVAIVLAAMYVLRLISAVLHARSGPGRARRGARPAPGGAGDPRPAGRDPAVPVRLAGGDHRPRHSPRPPTSTTAAAGESK